MRHNGRAMGLRRSWQRCGTGCLRKTRRRHSCNARKMKILRQKIKEIGAAVIRAASSSIEAASEEDVEKSGLTEDTISQKATA